MCRRDAHESQGCPRVARKPPFIPISAGSGPASTSHFSISPSHPLGVLLGPPGIFMASMLSVQSDGQPWLFAPLPSQSRPGGLGLMEKNRFLGAGGLMFRPEINNSLISIPEVGHATPKVPLLHKRTVLRLMLLRAWQREVSSLIDQPLFVQ